MPAVRGELLVAEAEDPTKALDTVTVNHGGDDVERQVLMLGGSADAALLEPANAAPAAGDYGLPVREGDGHSVALGSTADAAGAAGDPGTVSAKLRRLSQDLDSVLTKAEAIRALLAGSLTVGGTVGVSGTVTVDTELPAAVAASDALANPTAPQVLAQLMGWDGTEAQRARFADTTNQNLQVQLRNGTTSLALEGNNADAVGTSATAKRASVQADPMLFNETSLDRQRNNTEATLLASTARTATTNTADQTNYNGRGVVVGIDITATPNNAETLTVAIQVKHPVSGKYVTITAFAALVASALGAAPTTATFLYSLFPGIAETAAVANHEGQALVLPRTWRVLVTHSAAGSWTYSVSASLVN